MIFYYWEFDMNDLEKVKKFVKNFVVEVWCDRNKSKVEHYYDENFTGFLNGSEIFNFSDVLKRIDYSKENFEKNDAEFHDIFIVSKDLIGARLTMHRIDRNKEAKSVPVLLVIEVHADKIQRLWLFTDLDYRYKDWN